MVRTVNTKSVRSLNKGQRALLLPGSTGAEPWELWSLGGKGSGELVQICHSPLDNRMRKSTMLALPVSQVFCLPLWLNETDQKQFAGMITLQLELRGLVPRGTEPVFDWSVVTQEGNRTLVVVGVLPAALDPDIHAEAYESFDLSARFFAFPESALTIWREQDRLAVAITRGANLVYFQVLGEPQITTRVLQDLNCAQATLLMQDILLPLQKVMVWTKIAPDELLALRGAFHIPIEQEECPRPEPPSQAWKLTPAVVTEVQRNRAAQQWQRRGILIFFLVYLLVVGWLGWRYFAISSKVAELKKWRTDHAQALELVQEGRAQWKELGPVVDTKGYPLELLLEAAKSIPADQLHLTLFEAGNNHVLIKGEAKNVAGAFQFLNKLKGDPYFTGYTLEMGNPRPLPNDLAQFQIEGAHAGN